MNSKTFADEGLRIIHDVLMVVFEYSFHQFELMSRYRFEKEAPIHSVIEERTTFT
jgi:hypothetical protein